MGSFWRTTGGIQSEEEYNRQVAESRLEEEGIGIEEVTAATAKLQKAPGVCGISAEMLKAGGTAVAKW